MRRNKTLKAQLYDYTYQEFCAGIENKNDDYVFNFTDVIYYISIRDLVTGFRTMKDGVVGCGLMHVPKINNLDKLPIKFANDCSGYMQLRVVDRSVLPKDEHWFFDLHGDDNFKQLYREDEESVFEMCMYMAGNPQPYVHAPRFLKLREVDTIALAEDTYSRYYLEVQDTFDLGATYYKRFYIYKVPKRVVPDSFKYFIPAALPDKKDLGFDEQIETRSVAVQSNLNKQQTLFIDTSKIIPKSADNFKPGGVGLYTLEKDEKKGVTEAVAVVQINEAISAKTITVPSTYDGLNPFGYIKDYFAAYQLDVERCSDVVLKMQTFNKIVKQIMVAQKLDVQTLKEILFSAEARTSGVSLHRTMIPILSAAFKEAFQVEGRLLQILDSDIVKSLTAIKNKQAKLLDNCSIFYRLAYWICGTAKPLEGF